MNANEQIQEMENHLIEIQHDFDEYCNKPCKECNHNKHLNCVSRYKAERLYSKSYRKVERGEWIPYGMNMNGTVGNWKCSVCNETSIQASDYCPNCGADMRGE